MYVEPIRRTRCDHHHVIANELRLIVLRMKHAEAAEELRVLADSYERLAEQPAGSSVDRAA
jgi:hypothetical protein